MYYPIVRFLIVCACLAVAACGDSPPPTPSPSPSPGIETITGTERIGWDQLAATAAELATFRYLIYVDNVSSELTDVSCGSTPGAAGFACTARLPAMSAGAHTLTLSSFIVSGGVLESARSAPLSVRRVSVSTGADGTSRSQPPAPLLVTTGDGVQLRTSTLATGLDDPTDLALAPDGRVFVAERRGRILVVRGGQPQPAVAATIDDATTAAQGWGLLSIALDPQFDSNGFLYAVYTSNAGFRLSRYRAVGDTLGDRVVLLDEVAHASVQPAAAVRVGPDGKIYLALDNAGVASRGGDLGSFNGKVLRLNPDATTPGDQRRGTPVFSLELSSPRGLAWDRAGTTMWVIENGGGASEELRVVDAAASSGEVLARYRLTPGTGAASVATYQGSAIPAFAGDLFIAGREARALLRVRTGPADRRRVLSVERLLKDAVGELRLVAADAAGSLVIGTDTALLRLARRE